MKGALQKVWTRLLWWWHREEIARLSDQATTALQLGDVNAAMQRLEQQQACFSWPFQVEQLVFQRAARPQDTGYALHLLLALHHSQPLRPHQRFYAGIAATYSALDDQQWSVLEPMELWLEPLACASAWDESVLWLRGRNRESPYKQLVSARACWLQCLLVRGEAERERIQALAQWQLSLLQGLRFHRLPADVLVRSVTNLLRGLMPLSFIPARSEALVGELDRLMLELSYRRYKASMAQTKEDHLERLRQATSLVRQAISADNLESQQKRLHLIINSSSPAVLQGAQRWMIDQLAQEERKT